MRKKFYLEKLITGTIGAFVEAVIASTFGLTQQLLNCPTVPMVGLDLFSMENWRQCTRAEVQKMGTIVQVRCTYFVIVVALCHSDSFIIIYFVHLVQNVFQEKQDPPMHFQVKVKL